MKSPSAVPATIDDYIAGFPPGTRAALSRVRRAIRWAVPDAEEAISYQIPAFRLDGRVLIYFAGWASHYSIYPANDRLVAAFRDELASYELSGRGTIRFPLDEPVPVRLIEGIARFRAREAAPGERAGKATARPKPKARARKAEARATKPKPRPTKAKARATTAKKQTTKARRAVGANRRATRTARTIGARKR